MKSLALKTICTAVMSVSMLLGLVPSANAQDVDQFEEYYRGIVADSQQPLPKRATAALQLAKIGPPAKQSVPALMSAFQYEGELARIVWRQWSNHPKTNDEGLELRLAALQALIAIHPDPKVLVPTLVRSLKRIRQDYEDVPVYPLRDLVDLSNKPIEPEPPVPGHFTWLDNRFIDLAVGMVNGLKSYGPEARESVDAIVGLLREKAKVHPGSIFGDVQPYCHVKVRVAALDALGAICNRSDANAIQVLNDYAAFDNGSRSVRQAAIRALRQVNKTQPVATPSPTAKGDVADKALALLVRSFQSKDANIRRRAAECFAMPKVLKTLGSKATDAAPQLIRMMEQDEDPKVKAAAKTALVAILRN